MARPLPHKRVARVATVSMLTFMSVMAAIWLAPRMSEAVAAWMRTPAVRLASVSLEHGLTVARPAAASSSAGARAASSAVSGVVQPQNLVTVDAGLQFDMVGITAKIPAAPGNVVIDLRTSQDGVSWSRWYTAPLEMAAEGTANSRPIAYTEAMWTGAGRYVQVAAEPDSTGTAPRALSEVHVVAVNSAENSGGSAVLLGAIRRTAVAIAGLGMAPPAEAMTTQPKIVTRAQWGANESWRRGSPSYAQVKMAFVHHTDNGNTYKAGAEAEALVRGIYAYHTKALGWSDVGYDFLIDRYGTIYEGRYGGMTKGVIGAQVLGFNTGSTGVSIIGTFSDVKPPAAAVRSLEKLLAWKLDLTHVNPQGSATLICRYGQKFSTGAHVKFPAIAGHRQANYTDCPGNKLYAMLPAIRSAVAAIGQPKIYGFRVGTAYISPNGDGVQDSTSVGFTLSQAADWRVDVRASSGTVARRITGHGTSVSLSWAGKDDQGNPLADGTYTLVASATSAAGSARTASGTVHVDRIAPRLQSVQITPDPFSPNGDGHSDLAQLRFVPAERGTASVAVVGSGDAVLRTLSSSHAVGTSTQTINWDGKITSGNTLVAAPEGKATLRISLRDLAGNAAVVRRTVVVNRNLGFPSVTPRTLSPNGDGVDDTAAVGFKLTRQADVTLAIMQSGTVLRSVHVGSALASGAQKVAWDGKIAGADAASGGYGARLTAVASNGTISVCETFTVDCYRPRLTVPATATVTLGATAKVAYVVRDPYSPTVKVSVAITNSKGTTVGSVSCGWVKQGVSQKLSWKPVARGTYALTFKALDQGGNPQNGVGKTSLTVR
jgi:hypothetical protein